MKFKLLSFHTNVHNPFPIFSGPAVPKTPLSSPALTNTVYSVWNELLFVSWGYYVSCFTRPFSSLLPWTSTVRCSILCIRICSYFCNTWVIPLHTNYRHACVFQHSVYITLLSRDNIWSISSVQSLSCVRLYSTMDRSTPGLPVHHQLLEFTQPHVHWVSDAIQPSHPLLPPSPLTFNLA